MSSAEDEDPRARLLAQVLAAEGGALERAAVDGLLASLRQHLRGGDGEAAASDVGVPASALEDLELQCLACLLRARLLDAHALTAVHMVFARYRAGTWQSAEGALQRALAARDRQLSIATHELRTPIASILLNVQMLERAAERKGSLDAATVLRMLDVPSRQLRRLTRMVDLLLDSAQVESERIVLRPQQVDLCDLVHDAAARLENVARAADCEISLGGCTPVVGHWDPLRIEQVVTNLLTNAIKYGGARVDVRTLAGDEAMLVVRDHGQGIAPEDQERIFAPFERLLSAATEDGAGLGLYVVREIVRAHGGRIEVDSTPGQGATFTVHLPL